MSLPTFIQLHQIKQPTIRNYINEKELRVREDFERLKSTPHQIGEIANYHLHSDTFLVEADVDTVWNTYLSISPKDTWNSEIVSFGCMFCRASGTVSYVDDPYNGLQEGQVLFLNISLFWGKVNIAVAHKITHIVPEEKYIEFSYIEGGKTEGSQRLIFSSTPEGNTHIEHRTIYRGRTRSVLRERIMYPIFHTKVISAFHSNVKRKILSLETPPSLPKHYHNAYSSSPLPTFPCLVFRSARNPLV